jgi:soluble epoxide hydrolase / lipid-phosphate phosphatase
MSTAQNTGAQRKTATTGQGPLSYLEAGPATRPLVVLVHGWPATAMTWTPQITALAAAGYRVIAPDMRGYGHSFTPRPSSSYALRHLVADLLSVLHTTGRTSAIWIGHDWGAAVVWARRGAHAARLADLQGPRPGHGRHQRRAHEERRCDPAREDEPP